MAYTSVQEITQAVAGHTAPRRFLATVEAHPRLVALRSMKGHALGGWNEWTFRDYARHVAAETAGVNHEAGVEPGESGSCS